VKAAKSTSTFERFAKARVLVKPDRTMLAGSSHYPYGSVVVCLAPGRKWQEWCEHDLDVDPESVTAEPVGDPYDRMLEAAKQGAVGFLLHDQGVERFLLFMGRCDELSNTLPSILCGIPTNAQEKHEYLASFGQTHFLHDEIVHWQRFDILDPVNAQFGETQPFSQWVQGEPFYELLSDLGEIVLMLESDIFGPWHPVEGAVPLFSDPDCAESFLQLGRLQELGLVGLGGPNAAKKGLMEVAS